MYTLTLGILYFFIYSFVGWVHEFIYYRIKWGHFKTASFLRMPILPIYGFGASIILWGIVPYVSNPFAVFALSVLTAGIIEYTSHWAIEKLFHIQLWNYEYKRFHLHGRIAWDYLAGFGILALLLVYVLHPFVEQFVTLMPTFVAYTAAISFSILLVVDFANQVATLTGLRFSKIIGSFADIQENLSKRLAEITKPGPVKVKVRRLRSVVLKLHRANMRRLVKAFPHLRMRNQK